MQAATSLCECPTCRAALRDGALAGLCARCAWREFAEEERASATPFAADALFAVEGHDVLSEIARGGGGVVYRARQHEPRREVALKMLLPHQLVSEEGRARFRVEAEIVAALDHPSILPVYAVGEHRGAPFFTMKLAAGGTLAMRRARLIADWRGIASLIAALADAVHHAHQRGVIHRDLKPGNVLFDETGHPFVSDFGLAKLVDADAVTTHTLILAGTPAYLSPEVAERGSRAATLASDIYSLGAILYELLAGRPPFVGETLAVLLRQLSEQPPAPPRRLRPGVPRDLEVICLRCLEKNPSARFATAAELAADLRLWLAGRPIASRRAGLSERAFRWARRNPALATSLAALAAVLIAGVSMLWRSNRSLRAALAKTQAAENDSSQKLHAALLSEGRLLRQSGKIGQRHEALKRLEQAARIAPSLELRNEAIAALVRPDLRLLRLLPAEIDQKQVKIAFAPDFSAYLSPLPPLPGGGLALHSAEDGRVLHRYATHARAPLFHLKFSEDGRRFDARFRDFSREIWEVDGAAPLWSASPVPRLEWVSAALYPKVPAVAFRRGENEVWRRDLLSGEERRLAVLPNEILKMAFAPMGDRLGMVCRNRIEIVDAESGATVWAQTGSTNGVDPAWSADGRRFAWCRNRNALVVIDTANGALIAELIGHREIPSQLAFTSDGETLLSLGYDNMLRIWDVPGGREVLQMPAPIYGLTLSADDRLVGVTALPNSAAVFEWTPYSDVLPKFRGRAGAWPDRQGLDIAHDATGRLALTIATYLDSYRQGVALKTSGSLGGAAEIHVKLWDVERRRELGGFAFPVRGNVFEFEQCTAFFQSAPSRIVYGSYTRGMWTRTFELGVGGELSLGEERPIAGAGPGAQVRAVGKAGDWFLHRLDKAEMVLWPGGDPARERKLFDWKEADFCLYVSPDGRWAATADFTRNEVTVWPLATTHAPRKLPFVRQARIAFSPDGQRLMTGTDKGHTIWSLPDLARVVSWPMTAGGISCPFGGFSSDGRWIASAASTDTLELRDARSFALLARLESPSAFQLCAWAPDGTGLHLYDLAGGAGRLLRWDLPALRRELEARGLDW